MAGKVGGLPDEVKASREAFPILLHGHSGRPGKHADARRVMDAGKHTARRRREKNQEKTAGNDDKAQLRDTESWMDALPRLAEKSSSGTARAHGEQKFWRGPLPRRASVNPPCVTLLFASHAQPPGGPI